VWALIGLKNAGEKESAIYQSHLAFPFPLSSMLKIKKQIREQYSVKIQVGDAM